MSPSGFSSPTSPPLSPKTRCPGCIRSCPYAVIPCSCRCHVYWPTSNETSSPPPSPQAFEATGALHNPCTFTDPFSSPSPPALPSPTSPTSSNPARTFQLLPAPRRPKFAAGFFHARDKFAQKSISDEGPFIGRRAVHHGRPREPLGQRSLFVALPTSPLVPAQESLKRHEKRPRSSFAEGDGEAGEWAEPNRKRRRMAQKYARIKWEESDMHNYLHNSGRVTPSDGDEPHEFHRRGEDFGRHYCATPPERSEVRRFPPTTWNDSARGKFGGSYRMRHDRYERERSSRLRSTPPNRRKMKRHKMIYNNEEDEPRALFRRWSGEFDDDESESDNNGHRKAARRHQSHRNLQDQESEEYHTARELRRRLQRLENQQTSQDREEEIRQATTDWEEDLARLDQNESDKICHCDERTELRQHSLPEQSLTLNSRVGSQITGYVARFEPMIDGGAADDSRERDPGHILSISTRGGSVPGVRRCGSIHLQDTVLASNAITNDNDGPVSSFEDDEIEAQPSSTAGSTPASSMYTGTSSFTTSISSARHGEHHWAA